MGSGQLSQFGGDGGFFAQAGRLGPGGLVEVGTAAGQQPDEAGEAGKRETDFQGLVHGEKSVLREEIKTNSEVGHGNGTLTAFAVGDADNDSVGGMADNNLHVADGERTFLQAILAKLLAEDVLRQSAEELPLQVVRKTLERRAVAQAAQATGGFLAVGSLWVSCAWAELSSHW